MSAPNDIPLIRAEYYPPERHVSEGSGRYDLPFTSISVDHDVVSLATVTLSVRGPDPTSSYEFDLSREGATRLAALLVAAVQASR